jgi:hypothetical protein
VGYAHWRSLGRRTKPIPVQLNLLSILPSLGKSWRIRQDSEHAGQRACGQINLAVSTARRASQKGALPSAKPNAAKGASSWQFLAFLSPFTYRVLRRMNPSSLSHADFVADEPKRLIGDKAYDSDSLDAALAKRGIEMSIAAIAHAGKAVLAAIQAGIED